MWIVTTGLDFAVLLPDSLVEESLAGSGLGGRFSLDLSTSVVLVFTLEESLLASDIATSTGRSAAAAALAASGPLF